MKILHINGDDYCALTFEETFKGKYVSEIINNIDFFEKEFIQRNPDYSDSLSMKILDLNLDELAFNTLIRIIGDYDFLKTENLYLETAKL